MADTKAKEPATDTSKNWADMAEEEEQKEIEEKMAKVEIPKENPKDEDSPSPALEKTVVRVPGLSRGGKLIIVQDDPNSPLSSVKSFNDLGLAKELLDGVYAMGFNKPSKIQEAALPIILSDPPKNLIAQAQSGTGKTASFVLCMLSRADPKLAAPQCLCVVPTRELARQIAEVIQAMGKFTKLQTCLVIKDEKIPKKIEQQILVGTPGRILDLIQKKILITRAMKVFVLDEADVMIDISGLGDQTIKVKKNLPPTCQYLLFSATFKDSVHAFANRVVPQPVVNIRLKRKDLTWDTIQQLYIDCKSQEKKFQVLSDIYGYLSVGQSIIFVHTRKTATELHQRMTAAGHTVSLLHGGEDMTSADRDKVIDDYRSGKTKVLITTNVLARGIDILQVMLVINYDLPLDEKNQPDPSTYLHRIGRSGRFGRRGIAVNFVHDDETKRQVQQLASYFGREIKEFPAEKIEDLQPMLEAVFEHDKKLEQMKAKGELHESDEED